MQLPFSIEQFYSVFREYNTTLWPAQVFLVSLALVAVALVLVPRRWSGVAVSVILAFLWVWLGLAYHLAFFTSINPLAYVFAAVSLAGAIVFFGKVSSGESLISGGHRVPAQESGSFSSCSHSSCIQHGPFTLGTATQACRHLAFRAPPRCSLLDFSRSWLHRIRAVRWSFQFCGVLSGRRPYFFLECTPTQG